MTTSFGSALYLGRVMHQRFRPRPHTLRYRVFYLLLDIDEVEQLDRSLRFFSHNRLNLLSFYDKDQGGGSEATLRAYAERQLAAADIGFDGGPIRLLTMPRILGYVFNPLSIYFCYRRNGEAAAIIYEVNNTFGERHSYVIPAGGATGKFIYQESAKTLHVSPFLSRDMTYDFAISLPDATISLSVTASANEVPQLAAALTLDRRELSDVTLLQAFCSYPLLTLKVIAGIHWEALRIWRKGAKVHARPAAPGQSITVGRQVPRRKWHWSNMRGEESPDYVRD